MRCPSKYSNYESHQIIYELFFYNHKSLKCLLPLCNSVCHLEQTVVLLKFITLFPMMTAQSLSNASQPPQSAAPAQYSPCHSLFLCPCSLGPHTVAWVLGEHGPSPQSCHCAPQCQILSDKGLDPPPCCYFSPRRGERKKKWQKLSEL